MRDYHKRRSPPDAAKGLAKILGNKRVSGNYFKLFLEAPWLINGAMPGQFMLIKVNDGATPLLRKPFGFHRISNNGIIEVLCKVVGEGTSILSRKKPGEILDIIGPLGNGFSINHKLSTINHILVAGGVGVAPLLYLAETLEKLTTHHSPLTAIVLLGAKTKEQILCEKEFKGLNCEVKISTDDGSAGRKCFIVDCLRSLLSTMNHQPSTIFACGPTPMLKEVAGIAMAKKIPCQVLLEEYMACGVGVCLGCPVKTKDGYKMVCKDGPVFNADEVIWD